MTVDKTSRTDSEVLSAIGTGDSCSKGLVEHHQRTNATSGAKDLKPTIKIDILIYGHVSLSNYF